MMEIFIDIINSGRWEEEAKREEQKALENKMENFPPPRDAHQRPASARSFSPPHTSTYSGTDYRALLFPSY
jgi:hypothetical protein